MKKVKKGNKDNMDIDIKDVITLDGKEKYVVASKANYQNKIYYLLVNEKDMSDVKFCYEKGNNVLVESEDSDINQNLLTLFLKASREAIKDIDFSKLDSE